MPDKSQGYGQRRKGIRQLTDLLFFYVATHAVYSVLSLQETTIYF